MPELPEVETVRQQLQNTVLKKEIKEVNVYEKRILRKSPDFFRETLINAAFQRIERIGKLLQLHLSTDHILLAHLKMTGQFLYREDDVMKAGIFPLLYYSVPGGMKAAATFRERQKTAFDHHTHLIITFSDNSTLAFRDVRKFGYLDLISCDELKTIEEKYGIDPLRENFTKEAFHLSFKRRQKSLKAVLMDQTIIAGIGNIYADEICHQTKLNPTTPAPRLTSKQLDELYYACSEIIQKAVRHKGTTLRDYRTPDGKEGNFSFELKAYGREGLECLQCQQGKIIKETYLGRGTHYCNQCQR